MLSRAGIINVYPYGDETLEFDGDRLLLRGVNGSFKSTEMNIAGVGTASTSLPPRFRSRSSSRTDRLPLQSSVPSNDLGNGFL